MLPLLSVFGRLETFIADDLYPYRYVITPLVALGLLAVFATGVRLGVHQRLWRHRTASVVVGAPLLVLAVIAGNYLLSPLWERSYLEEESPLAAAQPSGGIGVTAAQPAATQQATLTAPAPAPSEASQAVAPDASQAGAGTAGSSIAGTTSSAPPAPAPGGPAPAANAGPTAAQVQPQTQAAAARQTHKGVFMGADDFHFGRGDALLIRTAEGKNVLRFESFSVRNGPDLYVYLSQDPAGKKVEESLNLGRLKATDGAFNYEIPLSTDLADIKSVVVWCRQFSVQFAVAQLSGI